MAEEEEEPSLPFLVVSDIVSDISFVANPQYWAKVKCVSREASGCGEKGGLIVDGLALYVRAGREDDQDRRPSLCIGATPDVLDSVGSEMDEFVAESYGREISLSARIYTVAGDVIVLLVSFFTSRNSIAFRSYYLVYDSTAATLFLLPHELPDCPRLCTRFPLKVGGEGEDDDDYSLVIMAESTPEHPYPVFLTWSPPKSICNKYYKPANRGWIVKGRICDDARSLEASVLFLHKGCAIWGDLGRGIMYCKCSELNHGGMEPAVGKFKYLPTHCRPREDIENPIGDPPLTVYRNMGCVGDSIWFVIIQPSHECPGETNVCVWTLDHILSREEGEWKPLHEFRMQTIWELDGFREQGLPESVPKHPILRQQDDGILYMMLPVPKKRGEMCYAHLVGIDLSSSSSGGMRLVVNRRLAIPWMYCPVIMDPHFFSPRHMNF